MVSDIYMFDLETLRWERIEQSAGEDVPQARYFHSADSCEYSVFLASHFRRRASRHAPADTRTPSPTPTELS